MKSRSYRRWSLMRRFQLFRPALRHRQRRCTMSRTLSMTSLVQLILPQRHRRYSRASRPARALLRVLRTRNRLGHRGRELRRLLPGHRDGHCRDGSPCRRLVRQRNPCNHERSSRWQIDNRSDLRPGGKNRVLTRRSCSSRRTMWRRSVTTHRRSNLSQRTSLSKVCHRQDSVGIGTVVERTRQRWRACPKSSCVPRKESQLSSLSAAGCTSFVPRWRPRG
mmetsp:Transcript_27512/g.72327  ORF Transcript_27512/g.72327 Transcript_27512/m.72327 type:complete len:221 (+) Transcript_27512:2729-3391(+)